MLNFFLPLNLKTKQFQKKLLIDIDISKSGKIIFNQIKNSIHTMTFFYIRRNFKVTEKCKYIHENSIHKISDHHLP